MFVGTLTFGFGGWWWGVLLGVFFVSSSLLSHFKEDEKKAVAEKFDKGHERDFMQAFANGGLGALLAVGNGLLPSPLWFVVFVGVMATVTADTWATELGTLARQPPRLITTGKRVATGTSGGVSGMGTLVSLAGGLVIGLSAGIFYLSTSLFTVVLIAGISGLIGSLTDSLLGATIQQIYICEVCGKETEKRVHHNQKTQPLRGWSWLTNDLVNLLASIVGGGVALGLWFVF
jgi:uncharacterized protein (TIGR00297 family)